MSRGMKLKNLNLFSCKDTIKADLKKSTRTIFAFKEIRFRNVENKGLLNLILDIVNVMGYLGNIDALVNSFMVSSARSVFKFKLLNSCQSEKIPLGIIPNRLSRRNLNLATPPHASRPGGVVASTLASHAEDQGSILVGSRSVTKPWCEW